MARQVGVSGCEARRRVAGVCAVLSLVVSGTALWWARTALAVVPGQNGMIAFTSTRDGNAEVYIMNPDGSGQTNLTDNASADTDPAFSPDGTKIAFTSSRGDWDLYVMNADGSGQTQLTDDFYYDAAPVYSPDSTKIAYESERSGSGEDGLQFDVFVINADGTGETNLTPDASTITHSPDATDPTFSPDGTKIAFSSDRDSDGNQGISNEVWVMNADGTGQTRLTTAGGEFPAYSPDGSKIAFIRSGNVWVMNADGSGQTQLTDDFYYDAAPVYSPDGTKIAHTRTSLVVGDRNDDDVYVMNDDGTAHTRLTTDPAGDSGPDWGVAATGPPPPDTTAPETTITSGPSGTTTDNTATFEFTASEPGSSFECQLDAGAFAVCDSPYTTQPLSAGDHSFWVRATDAAGNTDPTPASRSFSVARPALSIADRQATEGNRGTKTFSFTVTLSKASTETVSVSYSTADGTATVANGDYVASSGGLTFLPGETSSTINVSVKGDRRKEPNETFYVDLSNPTNATLDDSQGIGTITNDD